MKKVSLTVLGLTLFMVCTVISPVFAVAITPAPYTITTGKLGGADYVIYMPENWNGRLIMGCHGYNYISNPHTELYFDALAKSLASLGYAFASTNYNGGERGWLIKEGIIRTHQLTQYIVDNYHVTDKIFILGISMGGNIALNLAYNYPEVYDGVLDICGLKDNIASYNYGQLWATKTVTELRTIFNIPVAVPDEQIVGLKVFFTTICADIVEANGGTPEEKPQFYEMRDPVCHADIKIPTISLVGAEDLIVPISCHLAYQNAIATAGCSDLYRLYIDATGGHADTPIMNEVPAKLMELIAWSDSLD